MYSQTRRTFIRIVKLVLRVLRRYLGELKVRYGRKDLVHIGKADVMNYEISPIKITLQIWKCPHNQWLPLGLWSSTTCGLEVEVWFRACAYQLKTLNSYGGKCRVSWEEVRRCKTLKYCVSGKRSGPGSSNKVPHKRVILVVDEGNNKEEDDNFT